MVVCYFSAHIPCVKKCKFAPCIRKWKLRDPATASQFQSIFKFKRMTAAATVATTSSVDADTSNWVSLVKAEGRLAGRCQWGLWSLQEPPVETRNHLVVDWRVRQSYTREVCMVQGLQYLEDRRHVVGAGGQKLPTLMPSVRQNMPSRWQSRRQRKTGWSCQATSSLMSLMPLTPSTVYPKKYAHGFVVLCFVVVMQSFIMNSHEVFIHIHQGCFAGTGAIVRLPQCQWSKPVGYGKISQCITTTKHNKAKTVCIFLGIYCMSATLIHKALRKIKWAKAAGPSGIVL